ncbi:organic hydroperoxide resistance protein [Parvibaculum sp.]|uniref:organic hydroperoxide resistance protein n=1 Tax=Parvibaculum sp. TaxID=2024848 RepID=UPI002BED577C|nr:organic hydroperoxide resistance protein [Parvibaculum sp.]HUD52579.1 organic hydroperoxide resistance protein [Parvibaculum sp.]
MKILYEAQATSSGGRTGEAKTADGRLAVKLDTVKELGGAGGDGTNPEQLFAAGYSACFHSAMKFVAGQKKIRVPADSAVTAHVGIGPNEKGVGFALDVTLEVSLPGLDHAEAEALVHEAHQVCPYSNATRGNVDVKLVVL